MKFFTIAATIIFVFTGILSCTKNSASMQNAEVSIIGKWKIVNDSVASGIGPSNYNYKNYIGKPDDYFDFRTDGFVYIKEAGTSDTLSYQLNGDNKIIIESFGWTINGVTTTTNITLLTTHNASIQSDSTSFLNNPGGAIYERFLNLYR